MRKQFAKLLYSEMNQNKNIFVLTGDLGYGVWDQIRLDYSNRFLNVGSSEQLMLGIAIGMAMEGKIPFVYSTTPFLLYRPFEWIRNYLDNEKIPVKLIGGGRGKEDYGDLGFTHYAEEDKEVMRVFKNIVSFAPEKDNLEEALKTSISNNLPTYINLKK